MENSENLACNVLCSLTQSFLLLEADWVQFPHPSRSDLSQQHHSGLCDPDKGDNYPHLEKAFTNILCAGATGKKHRQPPGCPTFPFTLQHFKLLQAELPETVVNSWHWEFPWSQLACKKGCLSPPENNVLPRHCPNTSKEEKKVCFEQPLKKTVPSDGAPGFSYNIYKMFVSKETQFTSLKWF